MTRPSPAWRESAHPWRSIRAGWSPSGRTFRGSRRPRLRSGIQPRRRRRRHRRLGRGGCAGRGGRHRRSGAGPRRPRNGRTTARWARTALSPQETRLRLQQAIKGIVGAGRDQTGTLDHRDPGRVSDARLPRRRQVPSSAAAAGSSRCARSSSRVDRRRRPFRIRDLRVPSATLR
jgi:hypothetical protein